jgi:transcriptional regulator GlxA family with amidase domain
VLVKWQGLSSDDATWEPLQNFKELYPNVQLEDELFEETGRDVMTGIQYSRRRPISG